MTTPTRKGAEEVRNQLPDLLTAAENGQSTVITKHGRPVAAIVPMTDFTGGARQQPLLPVKGSGRGLWVKTAAELCATCVTNGTIRPIGVA
jgi:prevent-host-death family protein